MQYLRKIFGQQIQLKWDHYFLKRGAKFALCVIDVFNKYALVKPLKDKKAKTVLHGFIRKSK